MKCFFICVFLTWLQPMRVWSAEEDPQYYRGARAQGMGNAYVGLADDEEAVFLNPAGLAGNTKYEFHYFLTDLSFSNDILQSVSDVSKFNNLSPSNMNLLLGKNLYGSIQYTPMLLMGPIAFAGIFSAEAAVYAKNRTLPDVTIGYQNVNGFQFSSGYVLGNKRNRYSQLRAGFGLKFLWKRGGYRTIPMTELLSISKDELKKQFGDYQAVVATDLGLQYVKTFDKRSTLSFGLVQNDLGLSTSKGVTSVTPGSATFGLAYKFKPGAVGYAFTYDYRNFLVSGDWRKKTHFGVELELPVLSIYGGVNQFYATFGVGFNFWIFRVNAVSYSEELGVSAYQEGQRRYLLSFDLNLPL